MKTEKLPSNQNFGLFFSIFFLFLYIRFSSSNVSLSIVCIVAFTYFLTLALFWPNLLKPLNSLWYQFGLFLSKFTSPIVLGAIFFLLISPLSLFLRLAGRDILKLKKRNTNSYWIVRNPNDSSQNSFKNQY